MRRARGQATVELALTALVWVSILGVGLYLTEIHFTGLKVHEAAAFAAFEASRQSALDVSARSGSQLGGLPAAASAVGQRRYQGLSGVDPSGGGTTWDQVVVRADGVSVQCARETSFDLPRGTDLASNPAPYPDVSNLEAIADHLTQSATSTEYRRLLADLDRMYPTQGGVACRASAEVSVLRAPIHFMEGAGFFKTANISQGALVLCSPGRAVGGQCVGSYGILLGDFGLDHSGIAADADNDCLLDRNGPRCANATYQQMARSLYEDNIGQVTQQAWGSAYAGIVNGGASPIDERTFWMSFSGEEHGFLDGWPLPSPDPTSAPLRVDRFYNTSGAWNGFPPAAGTTPVPQDRPPAPRNGCWLGLPGC
jgi:hypothetical protein